MPIYSDFMVSFLRMLEPIHYNKNEIVYSELDEISEVIFFTLGQFDLGFELNGKQQFVLRYTNSPHPNEYNAGEGIGEYGCTKNKTSRFIYKTSSFCKGFFVRKHGWKQLLTDHAFVLKSYIQKTTSKFLRQETFINRYKK